MMRHVSTLTLVIFALGACAEPSGFGGVEQPDPRPEVMAAALQHLATQDHTFGDGPPPFTDYLVVASTDPGAGRPFEDSGLEPRELTEAERAAIEAALSDLGPVTFIEDPADYRTDDLQPTIPGSVILSVGEPRFEDDSALVPVSLWCAGDCGFWVTYRVEVVDGVWEVTGTEGPMAIS